jgi:hypothetical protein
MKDNLTFGRRKRVLQPPQDYRLIEVPTAFVTNGKVTFPTLRCYTHTYYISSTCWPSWTTGQEMRIIGLEIHGDAFLISELREHVWYRPVAFGSK